MPRPQAECLVIGVFGPCENLGEALAALGVAAAVEPERILVFLVEAQCALRTIYLIGITHLAPRGDAADEEVPHHAASEAAHEMALVVIGDGFRAGCRRPRLVNGFDVGAKTGDRPHQGKRAIDDVRRQIPHVAIVPATRAPRGCLHRIGAEILRMLAAEPRHASDLSRSDDPACQLRGRRANVVEARHVDEAAPPRCLEHGGAVGNAQPQRLLAEDMLAGREGRQRDLPVRVLRTGDHHRLHPGICHQHAPVRRRAGKSELAGLFRSTLGRCGADHLEARPQRGVEHGSDGRHRHGMGLAHVAPADDSDSDFSHRVHPALQALAKAIDSN